MFIVHLVNFEGPFDLLLQLIGKHKLDVTEIALSKVTDEFIAHLRALGNELDLDQASEFLVIASTLLDLKAARLLPSADVDDEDDLELLEARDLLFARQLQYKAYKQAAAFLGCARPRRRDGSPGRRHGAAVRRAGARGAAGHHARTVRRAARVLTPKVPEVVSVSHLHAPAVSVAEQPSWSATTWCAPGRRASARSRPTATSTNEVVARFLALLELYRQQRVVFGSPRRWGEMAAYGGPADADADWTL